VDRKKIDSTSNLKKSKSNKPPDDVIIVLDTTTQESDIAELVMLGFTPEQAREALLAYPDNKNAAVNYLISKYSAISE